MQLVDNREMKGLAAVFAFLTNWMSRMSFACNYKGKAASEKNHVLSFFAIIARKKHNKTF